MNLWSVLSPVGPWPTPNWSIQDSKSREPMMESIKNSSRNNFTEILYKFYNRAPLSIKFLTISVLKLPKYNILKICLKHAAFIDDFYQFYCIRSWWWCGCWEGKDEGEATLFGPKLKLLHFSVKLITRLDIICIIGLGLYRLSINISIYV